MAVAVAPDLDVAAAVSSIEELALNVIVPAPDNPRRDIGDVTELAASMSELGLLQPLVVTPRGGKFMIVCGHRRYAAAKHAKLARVPALIRSLDEQQRIKAMLVENCQRADLTALEEARAYQQLVDLGLSQRQLAGDVGKAQSHISKRLSLLALPAKVLKEVDSGGITIGDALELSKLVDVPAALEAALKKMRSWGQSATAAVRQELADLDRHKKREAEIDSVKADGIPYIAAKDSYTAAKGTMFVDPDRSWDALPMEIAAHAKLPCHAATVDHTGTRRYLCTDPKAHAGEIKQAKERVTRNAAEERRQAHERELTKARATRATFISELLTSRIPKDELLTAIVDGFIHRGEAEARKTACKFLGLEQGKDGWYGVLEEYAGRGSAEQLRAGLALALACREIWLRGAYHGWNNDNDRAHFDLLERHGYTPAPAERKELEGKAPTR